jgi:hypothetical protein
MMLPTHALAGALLALPVALAAPEAASAVIGAGFLGGIVPDLDLYVGHRRTLHYPIYYSAAALLVGAATVLAPARPTAALTAFLLAAAAHSVADVLGGGLELRPWEATSTRAVYDHYHGRWIAPRRWIGYDGSPVDLALATVLAVPLLLVVDTPFRWLVAGTLVVAVTYVAVRRTLPVVAERLVAVLPAWATTRLPARYRSPADGLPTVGNE